MKRNTTYWIVTDWGTGFTVTVPMRLGTIAAMLKEGHWLAVSQDFFINPAHIRSVEKMPGD
jgi:hypothetical protein